MPPSLFGNIVVVEVIGQLGSSSILAIPKTFYFMPFFYVCILHYIIALIVFEICLVFTYFQLVHKIQAMPSR